LLRSNNGSCACIVSLDGHLFGLWGRNVSLSEFGRFLQSYALDAEPK
jgi:hypothetical protein